MISLSCKIIVIVYREIYIEIKKKTYEKHSERFGIKIQSNNYIKFQTPRTYCAANSDDLTEVVDYVKKIHPNVLLGATGISMGG